MTLRRVTALVLFAFLSGCAPSAPAPTAIGTGGSPAAASPPLAESAGPIVALVVAADIDDAGNPVDPSFTVPADQKQITVIARIGELDEGSQLELAWYRLPDAWAADEGSEAELFRHVLEVEPGDLAWSIGMNPGTLVAGSYLVRAAIVRHSQEVAFEVPGEPAAAGGLVGSGATASGSVPASGDSGTSQGASGGRYCGFPNLDALAQAMQDYWRLDHSARTVDGPSDDPSCNASVTSIGIAGQAPLPFATFPADPCNLPGGRDLPGTGVVVMATVQGQALPLTITLGDDTLAPRINRVTSVPAPGTRVKAGDRIQITAGAEERRSGGPWQSGIQRIQLFSTRPSETLVDSAVFTEKRGKACDAKAWKERLDATYTVPSNPPAEIELCVMVEDWIDNASSRNCAKFPTGEIWTGTIHGEWRDPTLAGAGAHVVIEGDLLSYHDDTVTLAVAPDGSVSGEGSGTQVAPMSTGSHTITISGTRESDAFRPLRVSYTVGGTVFGSADWVVPIRGRTAEGTFQSTTGTLTYTVTFKLECVSCEEAVG